MNSLNAHLKLLHSKEHENALPGITPVPMSSGWVLSISHLLPHTVIIVFSSKAWRHHRVDRQEAPSHQPPHHNWHGHGLGSCSVPSAARNSPEGTTSLRSLVHAQRMPEGGRFSSPWDTPDLPRLHQITMAARYSCLGPSTQGTPHS